MKSYTCLLNYFTGEDGETLTPLSLGLVYCEEYEVYNRGIGKTLIPGFLHVSKAHFEAHGSETIIPEDIDFSSKHPRKAYIKTIAEVETEWEPYDYEKK